jgi:hypothetical protein
LDGTLLDSCTQKSDDPLDDVAVSLWGEDSCTTQDDGLAGGEQLSWSGETLPRETTLRERSGFKRQGRRIAVGIAGYLAQQPVPTSGRGQNQGGSQLGGGKIGKREANQND